MRTLLFAVCAGLVALCPVPTRADDGAKKAELKWARGVADDFLAALKEGDSKSAAALLTAEYAKAIAGNGSAADHLERMFSTSATAVITGADIAPDNDEIQLKGQLESSNGDGTVVWTSALVLRVVKEKDSGRWRVGFVLVEASKSKRVEPKKQ